MKNFRAEYLTFCEENGVKTESSTNIAKKLRGKGFEVKNGTGNKVFVFGMALLSDCPVITHNAKNDPDIRKNKLLKLVT